MAEQANPETGAAQVKDQETAVSHVAEMLEPEGPPEASGGEEPQATQDAPPTETTEAGAEEPGEGLKGTEGDVEPEVSGLEELPSTLADLAEAIGVTADEFAEHLKVPIKVNGQAGEATLAELVQGHQLGADYTQKTMKLADDRRALEAQTKAAGDAWQQRLQQTEEMVVLLEQQVGAGEMSQERLVQLADEDPEEYHRVKARRDMLQENIVSARTQMQAMRQQRTAEYRAQQQGLLQQNMPEVNDAEKLSTFETGAAKYLNGFGFSGQDVAEFFGGAYDHRHVLILRDAMNWRNMEKAKPAITKKLKGLPKVTKPGAAPSPRKGAAEQQSALRDRLVRTKSDKVAGKKAAIDYVKNLLE